MITFERVVKKFRGDFWRPPRTVLNGVSFTIPSGINGFLGQNGAGKTTLLKIVMGLIPADSGQILWDPKLGKQRQEIYRNIGYLPERPFFYPHLTGRDFLTYMGKLNELSKQQIDVTIYELSQRLGISYAMPMMIRSYSKGMLQRLGFISAIMHDPKLIILDEPLSGLDPLGRKEMKDLIVEQAQLGKTVFFSSHVLADVEEICERIVFIKDGVVEFEGNIQALLSSHKSARYRIEYRTAQSERVEKIFCELQEKDSLLLKLLQEKSEIVSLGREQIGLEDLLYLKQVGGK